ncbi:unnamed protein product [Polarella glacialis]|uniref:1,4-alpha-glucan branching enzyme n=1 Tax=Polarella glacialis TaxID=89957 RepID=A0A813HIF0_POLGL|nr:unnamed protein product [Polarella glacialis]|mmetsp:Transcript_85646/g.154178  ORF Transcript_85646/g.154178 Transcript_85646/m.154178 type:complete len:1456 (-) Transcript_85646:60-4427(-)
MLPIFKDDPALCPNEGHIMKRIAAYRGWKKQLDENEGGLVKFSEGYKQFGFHRDDAAKKWTFTEWLPKAKQVFLIGEFNSWESTHPLKSSGFGRWTIDLPDDEAGTWVVPHKSLIRLKIEGELGNWFDRVPAWTKLAWQDESTMLFNGVMWEPPPSERYVMKNARPPRPENLKVYEAHVGIAGVEPKVHSYLDFKDVMLPRIKRLGYNAVQLMAVAEHAYYGSFGYHVTSFFAPASRSGTPDQLKEMIDAAHAHGIVVLMDLVHAHCSSNQIDGIASMDGSDHCYTHAGAKGKQEQWDSSLFNFNSHEVCRFLLSNCRWWIEEYGFDGFRFDGVTSMLYHSHGIGKGYSGGYHEYFGPDADIESHTYMMLANDLIHQLLPKSGITVAEDVSGMPTLCRPVKEGGFGFDYRLAMAVPDMWIKMLKEVPDEEWNLGHVAHTLQNRRYKEPCIAYAESHDQAIVGDKSIAFWLMDAAMYTHMSTLTPSDVVDRGLALHKMIKLTTIGLGGEGYLNFIGNEFGHPEWLDFPTELNGGSYQHCRRRFDLPEMDHLKYKFFEAFDEVMTALDNRFKFVASEHQFCCRKDEGDKALVFERGDCLFVFNFHATQSHTDYRIGHTWNEGLRIVLDSDEGRFGGDNRLQWGHDNSFPPKDGWDNRYHSTLMYLPARTCQVLVRDSMLRGGVTIRLLVSKDSAAWPFAPGELCLIPLDNEGKPQKAIPFKASAASGSFVVQLDSPKSFTLQRKAPASGQASNTGGGYAAGPNPPVATAAKVLPFAPDVFRTYFPGTYALDARGNLVCAGGEGAPDLQQGDGVPTGCSDGSSIAPMVRSMSPHLLPPSEMPKQTNIEPATRNLPDFIDLKKLRQVSPNPEETPPGSGIQTPVAKNLPSEAYSDSNSEGMTRVYSLSALDTLLNDPAQKNELRQLMEKVSGEESRPKYDGRHIGTPVVVVSSEVNPWSKTGGLAMVAGSYGYEFAQRGHRTMVVSPRYGDYKDCNFVGYAKIWLDGREHEVKYFHHRQDYGDGKGTDYIFIEHDCFKRPSGLYWDPKEGREYGDNLFRFALLSIAALEAPLILNLGGSTYGQDCLFIANDWQAGLVPVYLLYKYRRNNTYMNARTIFVIHNMGYQGKYQLSKFPLESHLGLPSEALQYLQGEDKNWKKDCINLLAGACRVADRVITVSPNYAEEIRSPEGGQGLHELLRDKGAQLRLAGILNGIADEWDPRTDPHIFSNYSINDFEKGKAKCKAELQKSLGLHQDPDAALIGFCGRLCHQKGVHLIVAAIPWLLSHDTEQFLGRVQVILMGKGDEQIAAELGHAENSNKGKICGYNGFDPRVEHQMLAGCDFLLMPSQYEPCGLPQMYAQAYGTIPIVHETGGLKDSVKGLWDEGRDSSIATGFLFCGFDENHLKERMYQALEVFHKRKSIFKQMQMNGMETNFYWPQAIDEYERHVDWTLEAQPCVP